MLQKLTIKSKYINGLELTIDDFIILIVSRSNNSNETHVNNYKGSSNNLNSHIKRSWYRDDLRKFN